MDLERVEIPIVIWSRIARIWLYNLKYEYKNIHKDIFIDGYEWLDIIEDCKVFFNKMEELKPYIVEFDGDGVIKPKVYLSDCAVGDNNWQSIIMITHTFSANI